MGLFIISNWPISEMDLILSLKMITGIIIYSKRQTFP